MIADTYETLSAIHFDPIEKKPLYHFHPGSEIFSLGSLGCNFHCLCCQNYEISQTGKQGFPRMHELTPDEIIKKSMSNHANIGIAYTYNEPFVWYEYMYDIAVKARENKLLNVVVSNGYVNPEPLNDLIPYIDAFNIDLKAFDARSHKEFTGGELSHVLHTMSTIVKSGKHLEITVLVVPGLNDNPSRFEIMVQWIMDNLGNSVPLHLSRYFPKYKLDRPATSVDLILKMAEYARKYLSYVYAGNLPAGDFQNTYCPDCGTLVIMRQGYYVQATGMAAGGCCLSCGQRIVTVR
jgi:pyruvate formate lyase activating enzyme